MQLVIKYINAIHDYHYSASFGCLLDSYVTIGRYYESTLSSSLF